jgi:hypothetical protein
VNFQETVGHENWCSRRRLIGHRFCHGQLPVKAMSHPKRKMALGIWKQQHTSFAFFVNYWSNIVIDIVLIIIEHVINNFQDIKRMYDLILLIVQHAQLNFRIMLLIWQFEFSESFKYIPRNFILDGVVIR